PLTRILVALEATDRAVEEALSLRASLMVVHHPLLFHPVTAISPARPLGRKISRLLQGGVALYAAHTNLDAAPEGVSWALAEKLGLPPGDVLVPHGEETFLKLVVYVPKGYEDALLKALGDEGAGVIGRYSHCSFQAPGHGTFQPMEGTHPFLGEVGKLEKVEEIRLETIVPAG
ncbi:MAG: Nif3-like dinuclear metal center hexameric protein, partial [Bacillota bacterium]|nr:Nif3-like dinuclear metal center hexameric protein [Bacillota bacterium]